MPIANNGATAIAVQGANKVQIKLVDKRTTE
jgi:hypothetical protein